MGISFAGEPLLIPDIELVRFLNRYLPLEHANIFARDSLPVHQNTLPIGYPNHPGPPAPQINTLYWPTGASRWACGLFLADRKTLERILVKVKEDRPRLAQLNKPAQLVLRDGDYAGEVLPDDFSADEYGHAALGTEMFLLPPRPLSAVHTNSEEDAPVKNDLWLLPLVDVRWYWQQRHTGDFDVTTEDEGEDCATWGEVFTQLEERLGLEAGDLEIDTIGDDTDDYGRPDSVWMKKHLSFHNAAVVLDAVSHSIGHRIVRWIDGTLRSMNHVEAQDRLFANTSGEKFGTFNRLAGDEFHDVHAGGMAPEFVNVAFHCRDTFNDILVPASDFDDEPQEASAVTEGLHKLFRVGSNDPFTDATATAETEALANRIARDYYGWLTKKFDQSFTSLKCWHPTGFDDSVVWSFGGIRPDGGLTAQTRVQSVPYNFGVEDLIPQCGASECDCDCVQLSHGVIIAQCNAGCSTYRVQRVHRHLLSDCDDCGSGSGS